MTPERATEHVRDAGVHLYKMGFRVAATVIVLAVFAGLALLVYRGRVDDGALLLYAGVVLGYVLHAARQTLR